MKMDGYLYVQINLVSVTGFIYTVTIAVRSGKNNYANG